MLSVEELSKHYSRRGGPLGTRRAIVRAVDGVTFQVEEGEVVGIVGESGSGKTTLARVIVGLTRPTAGRVVLDGTEISSLSHSRLRQHRPKLQMVFQDPYGSLNPRMPVGASVAYPLVSFRRYRGRALSAKVEELLTRVGLSAEHARRLPHQLSGGQRQRAGIARAIALEPRVLVADEPTSALDLSAQAQILNVFADLRQSMRLSLVFVTHDLNVARYLCDRILVMYAGRLVEYGANKSFFSAPQHPYTQALLSSAVLGGVAGVQETILEGDPPDPAALPTGCKFHPRCKYARGICSTLEPQLTTTPTTVAACHKVDPAYASHFES